MSSSSSESPSQPSGPWQAPTVEQLQAALPQYEILELLGCGGMGAVYKARQKSLKRIVAIKILPLGLADDEFRFVERFRQEAETMAAMNHPAIVAVHDFGETPDGLLYFVMEFVDGTDVQKLIHSSGRLPVDHALSITAHVCDALAYAHARGVIHRDIKPANILINSEGHVKVADFGLAKMHDPSQTSALTRSNVAMGTPDYVAPEVLVPGVVADHRADLYAVGVMLYQMLTGEVPRGMFKLPSQKLAGSDPRFDEIIVRAMEQDRDERYQSAIEVRSALDVILTTPQPKQDGPSSHPPPHGDLDHAGDKAVPAPTMKRSAAHRWLSLGGLLTVLGVGAFLVVNSGKPPPSADTPAASPAPASAPEAGVIDWIHAPPAQVRPWAPEWRLAEGVLKPSVQLQRQFGLMNDGSVRLRVRLAPDYSAADGPRGAQGTCSSRPMFPTAPPPCISRTRRRRACRWSRCTKASQSALPNSAGVRWSGSSAQWATNTPHGPTGSWSPR